MDSNCVVIQTFLNDRQEGTGTRPDYLVKRADKKIEGPFEEKFAQKSRNSCRVNGGGVGARGQLTQDLNLRNPRTKYKRSKNVFAVLFLPSSMYAFVQNCYSFLRSL